ncbi:hypothetical protein NC652_004687 [Populus alba x Populus x berolinensis]|nr:hypothetical protein NC652_004687 [Populus alba x Populus x berolinensis]
MPKILITFMFYRYKLFNATNSYFFYSGPRELFVLIAINPTRFLSRERERLNCLLVN